MVGDVCAGAGVGAGGFSRRYFIYMIRVKLSEEVKTKFRRISRASKTNWNTVHAMQIQYKQTPISRTRKC